MQKYLPSIVIVELMREFTFSTRFVSANVTWINDKLLVKNNKSGF